MIWNRLCVAVCVAVCLLSLTTLPAAAQSFTSVVVFGDSLSDTGNFAHVTNSNYGIVYPGTAFNYANGRFTDDTATTPAAHAYAGVWVEQLAAHFSAQPAVKDSLDGGTNYAYGDATTADGNTTVSLSGLSFAIPNMGQQISNYLATTPTPKASTLYVVFGGANDLFADSSAAGVTAAAQREANLVQRLITAGATNFIVPNLPPLGNTPEYVGSSSAAALNTASAQFRTQLAADLQTVVAAAAVQRITVTIYQPDLYAGLNGVETNPVSYGFANATVSAQGLASTINADTYLFWDDIHPTTSGHHLIAAAAEGLLTPLITSTTTLTATTSTQSGSVTLKAVVSGAGTGKPTGGVTFFSGTTTNAAAIGSGTLDATGTAMTTLASTTASTVFAAYMGDLTYQNSSSTPQSITTLAATMTTLSASPTAVNLGGAVLLTATVVSTAGIPSGSVTFNDGMTVLGMGTLSGSGMAMLTTSSLAAGSHSIAASYVATSAYATSASNAVTVVVTAPSISLTFTPSTLTVQHGSSGMTTLTVTPAGGAMGTISLSCGPVPSHASCVFSPATLTLNGSSAVSSTLTVATNVAAMSMPQRPGTRRNELFFAFALLPLLGLARRRSLRGLLTVILALGVLSLGAGGCSSSGTTAAATTTPGTYSVVVTASVTTASGGTVTQMQTLSVVVQ